ncbi:hypothetical protein HYW87_03550, partial [Candidatus Roizmanbacteria bacterium]|nr:hypothetical protein [Candidatus Roizmanbacteria bacterium]
MSNQTEFTPQFKQWMTMQEDPAAIRRYVALRDLGKRKFSGSHVLQTKEDINEDDIEKAKEVVTGGITATNPPVWASWFEHVFISAELARRLDPKVEFYLWLHELGRLVTPSAYFRNDLINRRFLLEFGILERTLDEFFPIQNFLRLAGDLNLSKEQTNWEEDLRDDQKANALVFFDTLTDTQRIINLADNLGKRNKNGMFNTQGFFQYLQSQEQRYEGESQWKSENWSIPRRPGSAVLQAFIIEKTLEWLQKKVVDIEKVLRDLDDYGPKFVIIARHGQPKKLAGNKVYNVDSIAKDTRDIVH